MKYECEVTIYEKREDVIKLFDNVENLFKWHKGLKSFDILSGEAGVNGLKSILVYDMNGKTLEMLETIEKYNYPYEMIAIYEAKNVWNRCVNVFEEKDGKTIWKMETEFQCSGFMKLMAGVGKKMFMKQTLEDMNRFKDFVELN